MHLQDAELAVTLLYELGEGASEDAMKPGTGALAQLAQGEQSIHSAVCYWLQSRALPDFASASGATGVRLEWGIHIHWCPCPRWRLISAQAACDALKSEN